MAGRAGRSDGWTRARFLARATLSAGFAAAAACGCARDHRMSLAQFMEAQRAVETAHEDETTARLPEDHAVRIDRALAPYTIGPADVIQVTIAQMRDGGVPLTPIVARVDRDGNVELPLVGAVPVAGLELEDADDAIRAAYVPDVAADAAVHVDLIEARAVHVLVVGSVANPGLIPLRRSERTVLHAIVGAAGVTDMASGKVTLQRIRSPQEAVMVDLSDPIQIAEALELPPLEEGDILTVHASAPNQIFVGGLVNAPQVQTYRPGVEVTVLQALAGSGGLRTDVTPKEATLVRRMPDGTDAHVRLNLPRIATGEDPNIVLAAGDILWIPETLGTRVQDFVNRNIFLRAGVSVTYSVSGIEFMNRHRLQAGRAGGNLENSFDPLGFLTQNAALQALGQ